MSTAYNHKTIGGTGASVIVGENPYKTQHGLWLELLDKVSPTPDNEAMARGRKWEPIIADMFAAKHPEYFVRCGMLKRDKGYMFCEYEIHDPEKAYLTGQPDRLLYNWDGNTVENIRVEDLAAGLEIKTASLNTIDQWGEPETDQVPFHYLIQCQWYAGLCNLKKWFVAVEFFIDELTPKLYREYEIDFDAELYESLRVQAIMFWEKYVETGIEPPLEVDATTARYVRERFPENVKPMRIADMAESELIRQALAAQNELKQAEEKFESIKTRLQSVIGDSDGLTSDFGKVTWKKAKGVARTDWHQLANRLQPSEELIREFTKVSEGSRRFVLQGKRN